MTTLQMQNQSDFEIMSYLPAIITIFLIIFGWRVLYKNARKIASRNETYNLLCIAQNQLSKIEELGQNYWCSESSSKLTVIGSTQIFVSHINKIKNTISILNQRGVSVDAFDVYKLRSALTLNIEQKDTLPPADVSQKLSDISFYSQSITSELCTCFMCEYPPEK